MSVFHVCFLHINLRFGTKRTEEFRLKISLSWAGTLQNWNGLETRRERMIQPSDSEVMYPKVWDKGRQSIQ